MEINIRGFNPATMIDWPDRIAGVIYMGGCNFRCPYCHASSLVVSPERLEKISFVKIKEFLRRKKGWVEGVVIGGGEPTLQPNLLGLLEELKKLSLTVKLDTNGTNPHFLEAAIRYKLVDYVAMDIKAPLEPGHGFYTQSTPDAALTCASIKQSVEILIGSTIDYEFRTTVVPTILDKQDILTIAASLSGAKHYVLQQFVPRDTLDPHLLNVNAYPPQVIKEMATLAAEHVARVTCRL